MIDVLYTSIKNKIKLKDKVGMAVPKNTQTRFIGITYHIHYTSLRLLFSSTFFFQASVHTKQKKIVQKTT